MFGMGSGGAATYATVSAAAAAVVVHAPPPRSEFVSLQIVHVDEDNKSALNVMKGDKMITCPDKKRIFRLFKITGAEKPTWHSVVSVGPSSLISVPVTARAGCCGWADSCHSIVVAAAAVVAASATSSSSSSLYGRLPGYAASHIFSSPRNGRAPPVCSVALML